MRPSVESLLDPYDSCDLECDGMTRVLHVVLTRAKIPHTCMVGSVEAFGHEASHGGSTTIPFHLWIILSDGRTVDYRLRMWIKAPGAGDGGKGIPHGVFRQEDFPDIRYEGETCDLEELPLMVFEVLTQGRQGMEQDRTAHPCPTCREPYSQPPSARALICGNAFHRCHDCGWQEGRRTARCAAHATPELERAQIEGVMADAR